MMLIVVDGSVYPSANGMLGESLRIQFKSQVPVNVIDDHEKEKEKQMEFMNGDREEKYDQYAYFNDGLKGMKRICGPGRRVDRLVMDKVNPFE
jgi:hypothetical protein